MNDEIKVKLQQALQMFEEIYSKRKELGVGLVRLWSLKKMKDRLLKYMPLLDLPKNESYVTKAVLRDIDYIHSVYSAILATRS